MPRYTVLSPVKHGRKRHEIGARLELSLKAAEPLLELRHIELVAVEKASPPPPPPPAPVPVPPAPVPPESSTSEPAPPAEAQATPPADTHTGDLLGGQQQT